MCVGEVALMVCAGVITFWTGIRTIQILIDNIKQRR